MKVPLTGNSFRAGMLSALLVAAGMILSVQGCLLPPGPVIVQPPQPVMSAPPFLYVVPGTYVYFVADMDADIFFYQGYWYRPYGSRWYRATEYNGSWTVIVTNQVPPVVRNIPPTYRRVPPPSGRLPYNDVRHNWRTWERDRHWDKHDERKRERYEEENRGQGRGRDWNDYPDNSRRDQGRPLPPQEQWQDPRQRREYPYQDRDENRDKGNDKGKERGRGTAPDEHQGSGRDSRPQYRPPVPPEQQRVQQQEKKQAPPKKQQDKKKGKSKKEKKDQDSASQDDNEKGRNEQGQGKGQNR